MSTLASYKILSFFYFTFISIFVLQEQEMNAWKLVKNTNDIKVYVKNQDDSKIKRVKVETVVATSLNELASIIMEADDHPEWVFLNEYAVIIDSVSQWEWKYYGNSDLPWPVSNRDFVTDVKMTQDSIDYSVRIKAIAIPDFIPEKDGYVRVRTIFSEWCFNPLGNGQVHISFELSTDIGGKIPVWFLNLAITKGPISTIKGLLEQISKEKFKDNPISNLKEF